MTPNSTNPCLTARAVSAKKAANLGDIMHKFAIALIAVLLLAGCAKPNSQNQYSENDVGQVADTYFGTVVSLREVDITGKNTGTGALAGAVAGGAASNYYTGHGNGKILTTAAGAIAGGALGYVGEQALADHKGIEYTIKKDNGKIITVVQNKVEGAAVFKPGAYVMVQKIKGKGHYDRVMAANGVAPETQPKKVKHHKDAGSDDDTSDK